MSMRATRRRLPSPKRTDSGRRSRRASKPGSTTVTRQTSRSGRVVCCGCRRRCMAHRSPDEDARETLSGTQPALVGRWPCACSGYPALVRAVRRGRRERRSRDDLLLGWHLTGLVAVILVLPLAERKQVSDRPQGAGNTPAPLRHLLRDHLTQVRVMLTHSPELAVALANQLLRRNVHQLTQRVGQRVEQECGGVVRIGVGASLRLG